MKIRDAFWTKTGNMLTIECKCKYTFHHKTNRWKVVCPKCKRKENLAYLRDLYILANES